MKNINFNNMPYSNHERLRYCKLMKTETLNFF